MAFSTLKIVVTVQQWCRLRIWMGKWTFRHPYYRTNQTVTKQDPNICYSTPRPNHFKGRLRWCCYLQNLHSKVTLRFITWTLSLQINLRWHLFGNFLFLLSRQCRTVIYEKQFILSRPTSNLQHKSLYDKPDHFKHITSICNTNYHIMEYPKNHTFNKFPITKDNNWKTAKRNTENCVRIKRTIRIRRIRNFRLTSSKKIICELLTN